MACNQIFRRIALSASVTGALASVALVGAPAAGAQGCTGAPGTSGIQQYCEAVPRADGGSDKPEGGSTSGSGNGSTGSGSSSSSSGVSRSTSQALSEAGSDGAAIERLASGATPTPIAKKKSREASTDATSTGTSADENAVLAERVESPADPSASPLKAATNAAASGPIAGSGVVWSLVGLSALGAGAAVFFRRRDRDAFLDDSDA